MSQVPATYCDDVAASMQITSMQADLQRKVAAFGGHGADLSRHGGPMVSSVELAFADARKAIARGDVVARDASIRCAARFLYGILDERHDQICAVFSAKAAA